jgi:tripartite-type tricarboxylate transporter receptor subunit TctC
MRMRSAAEADMTRTVSRAAAASIACAAALCALPAAADEVADFYKGRTFSIIVGQEVGTGYDIYGRALARHVGRHIPGNPNIVVQNMVGASGIVPAIWLYNVAPRDGTVMMTFVHTVPFDPLLGNAAAKFDPAKFTWIGNMDEGIGVCGVSRAAGVATFDELRVRETVFGGSGATGPLGKFALAAKNLLGAKIKLVSGYQGSASVKLAMQRGEVHGICGVSLSTLTSQWRDELESGAFVPLLQLSGKARPELKGAPHVDDYAHTADDRALFGLVFGMQVLGRPYVSPPEMPPARREALRAALMATMSDPQFLADAAKAQIDISAMTGQEVEAFIARVSGSSAQVVERAKQAYRHD